MPQTSHVERHFTGGPAVRDIVIGISDGLTVPFALAAGLSGAAASAGIIVTAGLAEVAAGAIAMGLGGYLAARGDSEHYASERRREQNELKDKAAVEKEEIARVFEMYGLRPEQSAPVVEALSAQPEACIDFMMRFELGLEKPEPRRALTSAVTIGGAYIAGGLIPLGPYLLVAGVRPALLLSALLTLSALLVFGFVKARFTGAAPLPSALKTALVGGLAATAAFAIVRLIP